MFRTGYVRRAATTKAVRSLPSRLARNLAVTAAPVSLGPFMRIAVDVMGGDHGCGVVLEGAKRALQDNKDITSLFLVGHKDQIHGALPKGGFRDHRMRVIHAEEALTMDDKPAAAV